MYRADGPVAVQPSILVSTIAQFHNLLQCLFTLWHVVSLGDLLHLPELFGDVLAYALYLEYVTLVVDNGKELPFGLESFPRYAVDVIEGDK